MPSKEERIKNLMRSNEAAHKKADTAMKEALYSLLKTKELSRIKVTDLIRTAGVSRGTFYKHHYFLVDLLTDDLDNLINSMFSQFGTSLYDNFLIVFNTIYNYREKLILIYRAGLSIEFLEKLNNHFRNNNFHNNPFHCDESMCIILNGITFNAIYNWGKSGFTSSPETLAKEITEITQHIFIKYNTECENK